MSTSSNQLPLSITTASGKYSVIIGAGLVEQEIKTGLIHTVIADERFAEQFENSLVIPIKIAEENKNLATIEEVVVGLHASGVRRKDLEEIIVSRGGVIGGSVSKNTTYLVMKEKGSGSSKETKAISLGVTILTVEELEDLLK